MEDLQGFVAENSVANTHVAAESIRINLQGSVTNTSYKAHPHNSNLNKRATMSH